MLAAMEDLLDTWPGTLIVVSHDRYFLERVTDQQYGILDGTLRHLPGGVDEYLRLREAETRQNAGERGPRGSVTAGGVVASETAQRSAPAASSAAAVQLSGAERRQLEKELQSTERRMQKLADEAESRRTALADFDQSDFEKLASEMQAITVLESEVAALEDRWLELSELLG